MVTRNSIRTRSRVVLVLCLLNFTQVVSAEPITSPYDRKHIVSATLNGSTEPVGMEFLATASGYAALASELNRLGATTRFADTTVGYIFASIPRDKIFAALASANLDSAALPTPYVREELTPFASEFPAQPPQIRLPVARVAQPPLPPGGPYFPLADAGILELWRLHPEGDGRGTTIGFVDTGFDLLHPSIRFVRGPGAALVPKVVDMVPSSTPEADSSWVVFGAAQPVTSGKITFSGREWRAPAAASNRGGVFATRVTMTPRGAPDKQVLTLVAGVLWDPAKAVVRVDTDGDGDFTNNRALRDYAEARDIDWFGHIEGEEDHRIGFGVKIDAARGAAWISFNSGSGHGTWVATPASANQLSGGLYNAPAPEARLIDVRDGFLPSSADIIRAASRVDVDVVNRSAGLGRPRSDGREDFARRVVTRTVKAYNKPILASSGAPPLTLAINDYASGEMLRRNRQASLPHVDSVNSGVELLEDGTVNDLLVPSATMPGVSRYSPGHYTGTDDRRYMAPRHPLPPMPEGYDAGANPSNTIGYASGVVASLISLAKQRQVRISADRLSHALYSSARLLPDFTSASQGRGLIDAASAWRALQAMARADDPGNPVLTHFELARELRGIRAQVQGYAEQFTALGESVVRELWITRRGGYAAARPYRLALRADDGTFALAQARIILPRDQAVRVEFSVKPRPGMHVSFMQLIDTEANAPLHELALTTVVPQPLTELAPGVAQLRAQIPPRHTRVEHFLIDEEVQASHFTVDMPYLGDTPSRLVALVTPDEEWHRFRSEDPDSALQGKGMLDPKHHVGPMERREMMLVNVHGFVRLFWENRGRAEYETPYDPPAPTVPVTATLTVKHYSVAFANAANDRVAMSNRMAEVRGRIEWLTGRATSEVIATDAARGFGSTEVVVPENTTLLRLEVRGPKTRSGSIEVFAVDATGKAARVSESAVMKGGLAILTVREPSAGRWQIAVWNRKSGGAERYEVRSAALKAHPATEDFATFGHGAKSVQSFPAPSAQGEVVYAAFRTEPAPEEKQGVLIGLTPVGAGAF